MVETYSDIKVLNLLVDIFATSLPISGNLIESWIYAYVSAYWEVFFKRTRTPAGFATHNHNLICWQ
jgi:hypothetical protein